MELDHSELCNWGDMPLDMVQAIAKDVPRGTVVQLHNNGDPTLYPKLTEALSVFKHCISQFNTNGKLLVEKANEIICNVDVLTISVIENDPEDDEQYDIVRKFLDIRGNNNPRLVYRLLGKVSHSDRWESLPGQIARRILHDPEGSRRYSKNVTIPEIGICLDLLTHLAIDRYGNISLCVRFDPNGDLRLGNVQNITIKEAWNGGKRANYLEAHIRGNRDSCPGCNTCEFWGVPTGA